MVEKAKVRVEDMWKMISIVLIEAANIWVFGALILSMLLSSWGVAIPEKAIVESWELWFGLLFAIPGVSIAIVRIVYNVYRIRRERKEKALVKK